MALGAIRAFEKSGVEIPQAISVVGFDDIPEAGFFRPLFRRSNRILQR
jgi:DNA-binding LacI/PurR family transcriptional regulator